MRKFTIILFSFILFFGCNKHTEVEVITDTPVLNNPKEDALNEVLTELESQKYSALLREKYSALAQSYYFKKNYKNYYKVSKSFEIKSTAEKDTFGIINAKSNIGLYYMNKFLNDSAYLYYSKAEKLSKTTKNMPFMGGILLNKATILWSKKDFSGAETMAIKALKIAQKKGYYDDIYSCYIIIANSLTGIGENQKALDYYNKALEEIENINDNTIKIIYEAEVYNYIAILYQNKKEYKEAMSYAEKGLKLDDFTQKDLKFYCYLTNNIAYSKFKLGDKQSVNQFKEILKLGDSIKSIPIQVTSKTYLGEYYLEQKDTIKANTYFKDAKALAHKNNIFEDELKILKLLSLSDYQRSAFYTNRYISLSDSLQKVERTTRDIFARIEFETDEISSEKKVVEKQNNQLLTRIWIVIGFALLFLLVIILWFMNKSQKAKTRELLLKQEQQKANEEIYQLMIDQQQKIEEGKQIEKRRISQELHDGVMGRLSSIRLNLFVLNKRTDEETIKKCLEYIKDIQGIEKEIRTIAHDLNKNLFSDNVNFNGIVENLFAAIKSHSDIEFVLISDERIDWETVNNTVKINVFRIIQEALQNIDKYANATKVSITMSKIDQAINIEIKDDGIGFNTNSTKSGIGIANMEKRMQDIGGKLTIESKPNKGTKINLNIPN